MNTRSFLTAGIATVAIAMLLIASAAPAPADQGGAGKQKAKHPPQMRIEVKVGTVTKSHDVPGKANSAGHDQKKQS